IREIVSLLQAQIRRLLQTLRSQGSEIDGRSQREEALIGADVARRLLSADVLLARLQRQHPAAPVVAIDRLPDKPAGNLAHELLAARHEAEVRAAERHRTAQHLAFADRDVGAVLAGPLEDAEADRVEADDEQDALLLA